HSSSPNTPTIISVPVQKVTILHHGRHGIFPWLYRPRQPPNDMLACRQLSKALYRRLILFQNLHVHVSYHQKKRLHLPASSYGSYGAFLLLINVVFTLCLNLRSYEDPCGYHARSGSLVAACAVRLILLLCQMHNMHFHSLLTLPQIAGKKACAHFDGMARKLLHSKGFHLVLTRTMLNIL